MKVFRAHILVCGGTGCKSMKGDEIRQALIKEVAERGLADEVRVVDAGCMGYCAAGPVVVIYPEGTFY